MKVSDMGSGVFVGDWGMRLDFVVTEPGSETPIDISGFTRLRFNGVTPVGGALIAFTDASNVAVSLTTDGTDGKMSLTWPEDANGSGTGFWEAGDWRMQCWAEIPAGVWTTKIETLKVTARLA